MSKLPRSTWAGLLCLTALRLWLTAGQAVKAITYYGIDDVLFLANARHLLNGDWLGPYINVTLVKGPFYPAFIAGNFWLGLPLLQAQHLLYSAACLAITLAVLPLLKKPLYALLLYALLLFNPANFDVAAFRVIRDYVYTSLALLSLAGGLGLALRSGQPARQTWPWALLLGLSLAAFWLTREEGVWLLPSIGLIVAYAAWRLWRAKPADWGAQVGLWIGALALPLGLTLLVCTLNWTHYGLFAKTEFDSPIFKSAYGALTRVRVAEPVARLPVTRRMRQNIYDVSPAFRELRPYLEGQLGQNWEKLSLKKTPVRGEIHGGLFMWAFRDAVTQAGYYASGRFPAEYYQRLAAEIDHTCQQHWLDCHPQRASMAPPWQWSYLKPFARNLFAAFLFAARLDQVQLDCPRSLGVEAESWLFRDLTRTELCGWNEQTRLVGQLEAASAPPRLAVKDHQGGPLLAQISQTTQGSVTGFTVVVRCPFGCQLEAAGTEGPAELFPFEDLSTGGQVTQGPFRLTVEEIATTPLAPEQARLDALTLAARQGVLRVYGWFQLPLVLLAVGAYLALSARLLLRKTGLALWLAASAVGVGLLSRLALIALIGTTSFPATRVDYLLPAYPLMLVLIGLAAAGDWNTRGEK